MNKKTYPSVLTIAGFDGSGGAGIQGDIKAISALGCFATSVLTALPVQNTTGVKSIYPIPVSAVQQQLDAILEDIYPDAIKIGMVHTCELVDVIAETLRQHPNIPVVFDPVMVATSGHQLINDETIAAIVEKLFPLADVITPNLDEASTLAQMKMETVEEMYRGGAIIQQLGVKHVLIKGGHLKTSRLTSLLFDDQGEVSEFHFEKFDTCNTHGSGCTLSSAIASYLAQGKSMREAVALAQDYVHQAIFHGKDVRIGRGNGPLNHFFNPQKLVIHEVVH